MAGMAGELNVGPPLGVNPLGQMRPRIQHRETNKYVIKGAYEVVSSRHLKFMSDIQFVILNCVFFFKFAHCCLLRHCI